MKLSTCLHQFFGNYLPHIKGVSSHTIKAYRDGFTLFIPFAAKRLGIKTSSLRIEHLTADLVLSFLVDLEQKRKNTPLTRNHRLAAIKSLARMIRFMYPEHRKIADSILAIPQKRYQRKLIGFLYPDEIFKVMQTVDLNREEGFRDYCLLALLYDSGARASEISRIKPCRILHPTAKAGKKSIWVCLPKGHIRTRFFNPACANHSKSGSK